MLICWDKEVYSRTTEQHGTFGGLFCMSASELAAASLFDKLTGKKKKKSLQMARSSSGPVFGFGLCRGLWRLWLREQQLASLSTKPQLLKVNYLDGHYDKKSICTDGGHLETGLSHFSVFMPLEELWWEHGLWLVNWQSDTILADFTWDPFLLSGCLQANCVLVNNRISAAY